MSAWNHMFGGTCWADRGKMDTPQEKQDGYVRLIMGQKISEKEKKLLQEWYAGLSEEKKAEVLKLGLEGAIDGYTS